MKFCPECGAALNGSYSFCPECGHNLGSIAYQNTNQETSRCNEVEGFDLVHLALDAPAAQMPELPPRLSMLGDGSCSNDFRAEDYDGLFTAILNLEPFIKEINRQFPNESYQGLLTEINKDLTTFLDKYNERINSGGYPLPEPNMFRKCARWTVQVMGILRKNSGKFGNTIAMLNQASRAIMMIQKGRYERNLIFGNKRPSEEKISPAEKKAPEENAPKVEPKKQQEPEPKFSPQPIPESVAEEIEALEEEMGKNRSTFTVHEFDPSIDYKKELDKLVGLSGLKLQLEKFINTFKVQQQRRAKHPELKIETGYNCVFKGRPGTGKTTVARLLAGLLCQHGIIKTGQCVEVDATSLVSGWIGFSAKNAKLAALKAIGGVLFIDEAYAILSPSKEGTRGNPGQDVVDSLTPIMENYRNSLIVVAAGYDQEMEHFLKDGNTGLASRFKHVMKFDDYNGPEMTEIFMGLVKKNYYKLSSKAKQRVMVIFDTVARQSDSISTFANGRTVRNIFDAIIEKSSARKVNQPGADYDELTLEDVSLTRDELSHALGIF